MIVFIDEEFKGIGGNVYVIEFDKVEKKVI